MEDLKPVGRVLRSLRVPRKNNKKLTKSAEPMSIKPMSQLTSVPTSQSTSAPTSQSTSAPTSHSTSVPTSHSTSVPMSQSTSVPTSQSTSAPTFQSTSAPTSHSTSAPVSSQSTSVPTSQSNSVPMSQSPIKPLTVKLKKVNSSVVKHQGGSNAVTMGPQSPTGDSPVSGSVIELSKRRLRQQSKKIKLMSNEEQEQLQLALALSASVNDVPDPPYMKKRGKKSIKTTRPLTAISIPEKEEIIAKRLENILMENERNDYTGLVKDMTSNRLTEDSVDNISGRSPSTGVPMTHVTSAYNSTNLPSPTPIVASSLLSSTPLVQCGNTDRTLWKLSSSGIDEAVESFCVPALQDYMSPLKNKRYTFEEANDDEQSSNKENAQPIVEMISIVSGVDRLIGDYSQLLKTGVYSDVRVLTANGGHMSCHASVLSVRCPTIARLFSSSVDNMTVDLSSFTYQSVFAFISYLYTAQLPKRLTLDEVTELMTLSEIMDVRDLLEYLQRNGNNHYQIDTPIDDVDQPIDTPIDDVDPPIDTPIEEVGPPMDTPIDDMDLPIDMPIDDMDPPKHTPIDAMDPPIDTPIDDVDPSIDTPIDDVDLPIDTPIDDVDLPIDTPIDDVDLPIDTPIDDVDLPIDTPIDDVDLPKDTPINNTKLSTNTPIIMDTPNPPPSSPPILANSTHHSPSFVLSPSPTCLNTSIPSPLMCYDHINRDDQMINSPTADSNDDGGLLPVARSCDYHVTPAVIPNVTPGKYLTRGSVGGRGDGVELVTPIGSRGSKPMFMSDDNMTPMPDYKLMPTPHLRDECAKFGVKLLPKRKMIKLLEAVYEYQHPLVDKDGNVVSEDVIKSGAVKHQTTNVTRENATQVDSQVREAILSDKLLYQDMLMYKPLELSYIHERLKDQQVILSRDKLMDVLDQLCITYTIPRSQRIPAGHTGDI